MMCLMNNAKSKHYWLYVLKLEQSKFYIGITSKTPEERFQQHKSEFFAAEWTKLYKPLQIEQKKDLGVTTFEKAEEYENKITRMYVKEYGLDNVRGGNITYRGKMIKRGKYIWRLEDWKDFKMAWGAALAIFICAGYILWDTLVRH